MRRTTESDSTLTMPFPQRLSADRLTPDGTGDESERPAQLEDLCSRFLAHASGYGFGPEEIDRIVRRIAGSGE